jgi:hypothetical protein
MVRSILLGLLVISAIPACKRRGSDAPTVQAGTADETSTAAGRRAERSAETRAVPPPHEEQPREMTYEDHLAMNGDGSLELFKALQAEDGALRKCMTASGKTEIKLSVRVTNHKVTILLADGKPAGACFDAVAARLSVSGDVPNGLTFVVRPPL